ncbi:hypothetical protein LEP1GSC047_4266 [Leptospira inadai serovar Lyme str. 10]|uniref:Uncharacterized protein n=2 Tax=Leptospira inadai serovar Lyme TaxID=293084 RepID=V6HWZ4_9LEPT|nr:hypothetical protein [Leptospira inadai]EQA37509.1 hypothetical protein LEP1GSC047_4266 [Leptospira inadai serovar Lyme str. 10]
MEFYYTMNRILGFSVLFRASLAWLLALGQIFKNGKTSIHSAFKRFTGMSPIEYRDSRLKR